MCAYLRCRHVCAAFARTVCGKAASSLVVLDVVEGHSLCAMPFHIVEHIPRAECGCWIQVEFLTFHWSNLICKGRASGEDATQRGLV